MFVVLVAGVAPAFRAATPDLVGTLKDGSAAAGQRSSRGRSAIVVAEVALSMVLLVTGALLVQTFVLMARAPLGFESDTTMTAKVMMPSQGVGGGAAFFRSLRPKTEALRASVGALPGVEAVGYSWPVPFSGRGLEVPYSAERPVEGAAWGDNVATRSTVSPSYFETIGARIISGRSFTADDVDRVLAESGQPTPEGQERPPSIAVIDDLMAERLFPGANAVGRLIWLGAGVSDAARSYEVIGVVEHIRHDRVVGLEREAVFVTGVNRQIGLVVRTASEDPLATMAAMENRLREIDPQGVLFEATTFAQSVDDELAPTRFAASLALVFAGLAVGLAAVGLYGVIAYSVSQRSRDLAVRVALGASRRSILRLVLRQGMALALVGIIVGAAAAFAVTRVISSLLYGVTPTDVTTFVAVGLLLVLVTLLASYVPAHRATRVDPLTALRSE
jgi:predicted permease